jgi:hypothetical protein
MRRTFIARSGLHVDCAYSAAVTPEPDSLDSCAGSDIMVLCLIIRQACIAIIQGVGIRTALCYFDAGRYTT